MGSDLYKSTLYLWASAFQSTLPHGERRTWHVQNVEVELFQSTLPHGERLYGSSTLRGSLDISIHAPAWGATFNPLDGKGVRNISIHAPAWGATANMHKSPFASLCKSTKFQINFQIYSYSVNSSHIMSSTNLIISVRTSREFYVRFPFALQKASLFL